MSLWNGSASCLWTALHCVYKWPCIVSMMALPLPTQSPIPVRTALHCFYGRLCIIFTNGFALSLRLALRPALRPALLSPDSCYMIVHTNGSAPYLRPALHCLYDWLYDGSIIAHTIVCTNVSTIISTIASTTALRTALRMALPSPMQSSVRMALQ